ncbi:hypothetical protein CVT25_009735 [Psilocybe cyanescens]|uniref:FAD/NAD(P)-binding domain-containing protein n=1 Tax=Psilocybe cyanescens TaxID=93625 RepID=A0A409XP30_PSICY|nr:hypothetical protein CVT25_009735 [Psilocybe cyanescens]
MKVSSIVLLVVAAAPVIAGYADSQTAFSSESGGSSDYYQFKYPIKRVAIIGAGVGGLISYRELTQAGYDVHVYERDDSPGGNWHYTDEIPVDTAIPSGDLVVGDFTPSLPPKGAKLPYVKRYHGQEEVSLLRRIHRGPKPIWQSLTSNAPAPVQQIRETPWPSGTPWALHNSKLQRYLRAFASWHGVNNNDNNPNVSYNTRVELIEKRHNEDGEEEGWTLTLKELVPSGRDTLKAIWTKEHFDAVIVATGRYNAPNVPNISGIKEWNDRFPGRIVHSRQYRRPESLANQTVLIIGAATSGGEISRDIIKSVKKVYQSIRPQITPVPTWSLAAFLRRLPQNVTLVGEIKRFHPPSSQFNQGKVELVNGTVITGLDQIIFATGYRYTYPFLPQFHNSALGINDTAPAEDVQPIVTDGTHLRSLYLDAFYIPDPTLAFINANYGMQSFTYAEFISLAAAKIWAGKADFPSTSELWRRYDQLYKERKGYGRHFQFLGADKTKQNLRFLLGWLNDAAVKYGGRQIDGLSKDVEQVSAAWTQARFAGGNGVAIVNSVGSLSLALAREQAQILGVPDNSSVDGTEAWAQDSVYSDYW